MFHPSITKLAIILLKISLGRLRETIADFSHKNLVTIINA